jgi:hypothetical protein
MLLAEGTVVQFNAEFATCGAEIGTDELRRIIDTDALWQPCYRPR